MALMNAVPLEASSDRQVHHTVESKAMESEDIPESELVGESNHRTGRLVGDLCPTVMRSVTATSLHSATWAYTAFQRPSINVVAAQLTDRHGCVLVGIHFDKSEAAVRLEPRLDHVTEVLEERNEIVLGSVWRKVAHIARSLPLRSLLYDHIIALDAVSRKVVMTVRRSWGHSHSGHCLLLGNGRLAFLVGPIAAYRTRSQPLAVHRAQCFLSVTAVAERNKTIPTRATSFHVPHDACFRDGTKGRKSLQKDLIIDFVA